MKDRSSSTLYAKPKTNHQVTWTHIPTYAESDLITHDENNARCHAQKLYQYGANLLNTRAKPTANQLLEQYNQLPEYNAENGRHLATNPLHALFIIKVALDNTDAKEITLLYYRLKFELSSKTMSNIPIDFPNGSSMFNDHAVLQLLRAYILNQQDRFKFLSEADKSSIEDKANVILSSYIFVAGQARETKQWWNKVDEILSAKMEQPKQEESQGMRVVRLMRTK